MLGCSCLLCRIQAWEAVGLYCVLPYFVYLDKASTYDHVCVGIDVRGEYIAERGADLIGKYNATCMFH